MRKTIACILLAALLATLTACGKEEVKPVDLNALYDGFGETLPEMILMDEVYRMNFFGIDSADCTQVVTAVCANGLRTDEVWLIEAKDAAALERLQTLAESRLKAKAEETMSYSPDQYAVVQQGELIVAGNYLILLVSPDVQTLKAQVEAAFQ